MDDLNGFQRDCLIVLAGMDAPKGLAIKRELDEYYEEAINPERLYPNLDALVEKGLVQKGQRDERTNAYELTTQAERELKSRREWEAEQVDVWQPLPELAGLAGIVTDHGHLSIPRGGSPRSRLSSPSTGSSVSKQTGAVGSRA